MTDSTSDYQQRIEAGRAALARRDDAGAAEAEQLFRQALAIMETQLSPDHPDHVVLLNDLTRLYLKQSQHALAEPLLLRLHEIKRAKGDEHPEVATVLASLAAVRQALGRHDEAEQLGRRVLEIRERTLAPNHFAIATALEHLADTCAARGKFGEALPLLQRALTIRELTLGAGHASLPVSRERIADLQLQASENFLAIEEGDARSAEPRRASPVAASDTGASPPTPEPASRRSPSSTAAAAPALAAAPVLLAAEPLAAEAFAALVPATRAMSAPAAFEPVSADDSAQQHALVLPSVGGLLALQEELQEMEAREAATGQGSAFSASVQAALRKRSTQATIAGVSAVALLVAALSASSRAREDDGQQLAGESLVRSEPLPAAVAPTPDTSVTSVRLQGTANGSLALPTLASAVSTRVASPVRPRTAPARNEESVRKRPSEEPADVATLPAPAPRELMLRLDSAVRAVNLHNKGSVDPPPMQLSAFAPSGRITTSEYVESLSAPTNPKLIGSLPKPIYPAILRDRKVEGDVLVQFLVDSVGRPDLSTLKVVRSPHELLTTAVRNVLTRARFAPARTAAPESKPRGEWVAMAFQFVTATK